MDEDQIAFESKDVEAWDNSIEQKIWVLMKVWAEARFNFAYFDQVQELDWYQEVRNAMPGILATRGKTEFYRLLQELVAKLNDGHTFILPPIEEYTSLEHPPIELEMIEDKIVIVRVGDSEETKRQRITPGLEVVKVDGIPVREYLETNFIRLYSGGTKHWGEAFGLSRLLRGPPNSRVTIAVKGADGGISEVELTRNPKMENGANFIYRVDDHRPLVEKKVFDDIVYFRLSTFIFDEIVDDFTREIDQLDLDKTGGMIIDIRYNIGGNSENAYKIVSQLIDGPVEAAKWRTRKYLPAFRAWGVSEEWHEDSMGTIEPSRIKNYSGPLVVLAGHNTASAAEDFLLPLKFSNRATVIGNVTAGSTGNPLTVLLPGGYIFRVCTKVDTFPDGETFVGVGIEPDIDVPLRKQDVFDGRDAALNKAVEVIQK